MTPPEKCISNVITCKSDSLKLQAVESGTAPDLEGTETTYKFGYATLIIAGSQRVEPISGGPTQHYEVLKYLLSCGLPPNVPDICGFTALHHSVIGESIHCKEDLIRLLIQSGANVNCQNRYGEVPLFGAMQRNDILGIELLMEYGADVHIAEADGNTPDGFYLVCGPQVTAAFRKWIGKRKGEEAPRVEKRCDTCGDSDKPLKNCSKCHVARYCSTECQSTWILFSFPWFLTPISEKAWRTHKTTCVPFSASNTVTLIPFYDNGNLNLMPLQHIPRKKIGIPIPVIPDTHARAAHIPKGIADESKNIIIKIQVPMTQQTNSLLIYTKKRDFVCYVRRGDCPQEYDKVMEVVKTKGAGGAKAYFAAELRSKDELVVKISQVLAEQPF